MCPASLSPRLTRSPGNAALEDRVPQQRAQDHRAHMSRSDEHPWLEATRERWPDLLHPIRFICPQCGATPSLSCHPDPMRPRRSETAAAGGPGLPFVGISSRTTWQPAAGQCPGWRVGHARALVLLHRGHRRSSSWRGAPDAPRFQGVIRGSARRAPRPDIAAGRFLATARALLVERLSSPRWTSRPFPSPGSRRRGSRAMSEAIKCGRPRLLRSAPCRALTTERRGVRYTRPLHAATSLRPVCAAEHLSILSSSASGATSSSCPTISRRRELVRARARRRAAGRAGRFRSTSLAEMASAGCRVAFSGPGAAAGRDAVGMTGSGRRRSLGPPPGHAAAYRDGCGLQRVQGARAPTGFVRDVVWDAVSPISKWTWPTTRIAWS